MSDAFLEAVRALHVAEPDLGPKPLLTKLREQQPDLKAAAKEVREALTAVQAESEAAKAAAARSRALGAGLTLCHRKGASEWQFADEVAPPAADQGGAPLPVALSLACIGCARLPSDMDDEREKHPICDMCRDEKLPTTYLCGVDCPANPGAWKLHAVYHKEVKNYRKRVEDGGERQQRSREAAEEQARHAAQTGNEYDRRLADGLRYQSKEDCRKAAKAYREAIALRPNEPVAYYNLGNALNSSGHDAEAAQWFLEAKERFPVGSERWAQATAYAFDLLKLEVCSEVAKPEWWNDEGLKALSARVVRAAPNQLVANGMRAVVLSGWCTAAGRWGSARQRSSRRRLRTSSGLRR